MKKLIPAPFLNRQRSGRTVLIVLLTLFVLRANAQTTMSFTGTPVVSGTPGAINTTYTYNNVGTEGSTNISAVITITAKEGGASLYMIDANSGGSSVAWQPVVNGPNTGNGGCWGMTFSISFYNAATGVPLTLSAFTANGIDIDGNGGQLREYNEPYGLSSYTVENPTNLTVSSASGGFRFSSPKTQYSGILLTQTNVASSWNYTNTQSMSIKIGACCVGGSCSASGASERQYSINFREMVPYDWGMTILPVHFLSVFGQHARSKNYLYWQVANEANLKEYIVERSTNGAEGFVKAGSTAAINDGAHEKQYRFVDEQVAQNCFYRIKAVDRDGRYRYSQTIRIAGGVVENKLTLLNSKGNIEYEIFADAPGEMQVKVADMNGRILYSKSVYAQPGINRYPIENLASQARGLYFLHIVTRDGVKYGSKFVK